MLKVETPNNQKMLTKHLLHILHCAKAGHHKKLQCPSQTLSYLSNMFPNDYQIQFVYFTNLKINITKLLKL